MVCNKGTCVTASSLNIKNCISANACNIRVTNNVNVSLQCYDNPFRLPTTTATITTSPIIKEKAKHAACTRSTITTTTTMTATTTTSEPEATYETRPPSSLTNFPTITSTTLITTLPGQIILSVECLVVVDSTVYEFFQNLYPYSSDSVIRNYIKFYFSQVLNQVFVYKVNFHFIHFIILITGKQPILVFIK